MRKTLPFLCLLIASTAHAEWGQFDFDFDENVKPWQEVQAQLPPYPKTENLVPFQVSATNRNAHFIDFPSVSVGEDNVVRYVVVVRTQGGAENVSFEGMRCTAGERKIYAFGRGDGKGGGEWARNRYARWEPIRDRDPNSYQRELFNSYLCAGGSGEPDLKRVQWLLKSGGYKVPY